MKKLISFLLAAVMLISLLPTAALAEEEEAATYSIFDMDIPFENMVDCYRTTSTTIGYMQQLNYFDYVYSGIHGKQIDALVPDVVNNPDDYYYRFSKGSDGVSIVLTLYKYGNANYSFVLSNDGAIQTYGEACFIYVADDGYYGTFVSFRDKEYHMCSSRSSHTVNYPRDDESSLESTRRSCILCGCGETFIIEGRNPTIAQLEALPLTDGMLQVEHEHRYGSSGKCACGKVRYSAEVDSSEAGAYEDTEVEGLDAVLEDHFPGEEDTVEVFLQIKEETENEAETQAITQAADGQQLDFLDLSLIKIFNGGEPQDIGSDNNRLLAVTLPYSSWGKHVETVYRYHNGNVDLLTTIPNSDGEYFVATKETVTVYAKKFSTYAIGYMEIEESLQSVTYEYSVVPTYTVTIPSEVKLGQTSTVAANNVVLEYGKYVRVLLCNTSDDQGAFALQNSFGDKIGYDVTVDGDAVELGQTLLEVHPGTSADGSVELTFSQPTGVQYSGSYTGTVTFAILLEAEEDAH